MEVMSHSSSFVLLAAAAERHVGKSRDWVFWRGSEGGDFWPGTRLVSASRQQTSFTSLPAISSLSPCAVAAAETITRARTVHCSTQHHHHVLPRPTSSELDKSRA